MDYILYEQHDEHIAVITLNRPERLNALGSQMRLELEEALQTVACDPEVRVAIITGAVRAFCAGADVKEWAALSASGPLRPSTSHGWLDYQSGYQLVVVPVVVLFTKANREKYSVVFTKPGRSRRVLPLIEISQGFVHRGIRHREVVIPALK